jgi:hypothetical protein
MNLLKKKQLQSQLKEIKSCNSNITQYLDYLVDKYSLEEEKQQISVIKQHLFNLNLIFEKMLEQTKR